jgi:hypothetical protein
MRRPAPRNLPMTNLIVVCGRYHIVDLSMSGAKELRNADTAQKISKSGASSLVLAIAADAFYSCKT